MATTKRGHDLKEKKEEYIVEFAGRKSKMK